MAVYSNAGSSMKLETQGSDAGELRLDARCWPRSLSLLSRNGGQERSRPQRPETAQPLGGRPGDRKYGGQQRAPPPHAQLWERRTGRPRRARRRPVPSRPAPGKPRAGSGGARPGQVPAQAPPPPPRPHVAGTTAPRGGAAGPAPLRGGRQGAPAGGAAAQGRRSQEWRRSAGCRAGAVAWRRAAAPALAPAEAPSR